MEMHILQGIDPRLTLQKLEVFLLVAELGSVTRAAAELLVAQPVVTGHMRTLEQRVGATLLVRRRGRMVPTEAGERVLSWAREVVRSGRDLHRDLVHLGAGDAGEAVVSTSMTVGSYLVPPLLVGFHEERPRAEITLLVGDPERAIGHVRAGTSDMAVLVTDDPVGHPDLDIVPLRPEPLVLVGPPAAPPRTLDAAEVVQLPFVCAPNGSARRSMVDRALRQAGVLHRNVVLQLASPEALKTSVQLGSGYAFLFRSSVQAELESGALREVPTSVGELGVPLVLVRQASRTLTPLQQQLFDRLAGAFSLA